MTSFTVDYTLLCGLRVNYGIDKEGCSVSFETHDPEQKLVLEGLTLSDLSELATLLGNLHFQASVCELE